jgi:hypothetical protein
MRRTITSSHRLSKDWAWCGAASLGSKRAYASAASYDSNRVKAANSFGILDHAFRLCASQGPRAVVSQLKENTIIGLSWSVLDYDDESQAFQSVLEPLA